MRLLWQLHHIFMVLISSKCSDLSGPFSGGEGRRCRSGPCSADSFNCLMVLIHWNKSGILPALIYCRVFWGFFSPNACADISTNFNSLYKCLEFWSIRKIPLLAVFLWERGSNKILHLLTLGLFFFFNLLVHLFAARWRWGQDPGNHPRRIHLQHWRLCLAAGEGGQLQAFRHLAAHLHRPQRGGRTAHVPDSQGEVSIHTTSLKHAHDHKSISV